MAAWLPVGWVVNREERVQRAELCDGFEHIVSDRCDCGYEWHVVAIGDSVDHASMSAAQQEADKHRAKFHHRKPDGACAFTVDLSDPRFHPRNREIPRHRDG